MMRFPYLLLQVYLGGATLLIMGLSACHQEEPVEPASTTTSTINPPPPPPQNWNYTDNYSGQTWVIYQYADSLINDSTSVSDTLLFISDSTCTYNGVPTRYSSGGNYHDHQAYLKLYGTRWGDLITGNGSGDPAISFNSQGYANGLYFYDVNYHPYFLWIQKL